jgi:DNA segregation ATPase FtsK/SpoIIIE-like protein
MMTSNGMSGRWSDRMGKGLIGKGILALTCAAVAVTALPAINAGGGLSLVPEASAQEARDIDSFYEDLSPYGDWVEHPDNGYVFIPTGVSPDWRPYTVGQWIWTEEYGWYWESEEPFGWATFHYGRWGYDDDYGWYWVPGDEWAPAWVNWRDSEDDSVTGWAPIAPPRQGYAVGYVGNPEPAIEQSWVFVPTARMVSPRVYQYAYPVRETVVYVNRTPRRWYLPRDRFYVNRPFARERVVKYVGVGNVPIRKVTIVDRRPAWGARSNDAIFVYRPRYDRTVVVRKPPRVVKKVEVVKKVKVEKTVIKKDVKKETDVKKVNVREENNKKQETRKEENRKEEQKQQRREDQAKQERQDQKAKQDQKDRQEQKAKQDQKDRQEQKQRQEAKQEQKARQEQKAQKQQNQEQKAQKQQNQEQKAQKQEKQQRQEQKAQKQEKQQQKAEKQKAKCENNPNKCN